MNEQLKSRVLSAMGQHHDRSELFKLRALMSATIMAQNKMASFTERNALAVVDAILEECLK